MTVVRRLAAAVLLILALVAATALGYAQAQRSPEPVLPFVLSGADVGFRVEGRKPNSVVGTFVVRIGGQWLEVDKSFGPRPLTSSDDEPERAPR